MIVESFEYEQKGNHKGTRWDVSKFQKIMFKQKLAIKPSFYSCFDEKNNHTKSFLEEIKYFTTGERNRIIELTGQTGSGKSIASISLALNYMNKPLKLEDINFTTESILSRAMDIGKSHILIKDEQSKEIGIGSKREEYEQAKLEDSTRKYGLSIIYCSPTTKDHTTAHHNLEIICINKKLRLTKIGIIGFNGEYAGYIIIKVIKESHKLWIAYEKKKDDYIKTVLDRAKKGLDLDLMSLSMAKHKQFKYTKTKEQKKLICLKLYPHLTTQEVTMVVENYLLLQNEKHA